MFWSHFWVHGSCCSSHATVVPWACIHFLFPFIGLSSPGALEAPGVGGGELALARPVLTNVLLGLLPAWGQTRALVQGLDAALLPLKAGQEWGQGRPWPPSWGAVGVLTKTVPPSEPVCLLAHPHPFKDTPGKCREGWQE